MYWLQPPSHLRRAGAVLLVLGALVWDLRGAATEPIPVAATPIGVGAVIEATDVAWVDAPAGLIPPADPIGSTAAVAIAAGEPLTDSVLSGPIEVPDGWWIIPIAIGTLATPGDEVMLVVVETSAKVVGVVIEAQLGDPFDLGHRPAAVAVPPESASLVAAAAQQGLLVTAVRPTPSGM